VYRQKAAKQNSIWWEPIILRGLLPAKYPAHFSGLAFQNFPIPGETISNLWIFSTVKASARLLA
jgi:hypothetical protein